MKCSSLVLGVRLGVLSLALLLAGCANSGFMAAGGGPRDFSPTGTPIPIHATIQTPVQGGPVTLKLFVGKFKSISPDLLGNATMKVVSVNGATVKVVPANGITDNGDGTITVAQNITDFDLTLTVQKGNKLEGETIVIALFDKDNTGGKYVGFEPYTIDLSGKEASVRSPSPIKIKLK